MMLFEAGLITADTLKGTTRSARASGEASSGGIAAGIGGDRSFCAKESA